MITDAVTALVSQPWSRLRVLSTFMQRRFKTHCFPLSTTLYQQHLRSHVCNAYHVIVEGP